MKLRVMVGVLWKGIKIIAPRRALLPSYSNPSLRSICEVMTHNHHASALTLNLSASLPHVAAGQ